MNELQATIKKYNKIYVIELFVIAAVVIVLATLKLVGVIGGSANFRRVFNIITLVAALYLIVDFVWFVASPKRQKRNSWFDKVSVMPLPLAMIAFDTYCLINWNEEVISFSSTFIAIAFYYLAAIYVAQGIYHIYKPAPSIVQAAYEEYNEQQKLEADSQNKDNNKDPQ